MRKICFFLSIIAALNGCAAYKVYYAYSISAKNTGAVTIRDVSITSDEGFWHRTGYLPKGAVKTLGGLKSAPPNGVYTISVERVDREKIENVIDLRGVIQKGFRGDIVFLFDDNNEVMYDIIAP